MTAKDRGRKARDQRAEVGSQRKTDDREQRTDDSKRQRLKEVLRLDPGNLLKLKHKT